MTTSAAVTAEPDLIARREGSAGIIRLNRPKAINAVTLEMFRHIDKALDQFEADPAVAVIVLEGAGERGLCAGGDIRALYDSSARCCGATSTFSTPASPNSQNPMSPSWMAS
jgi:enoyl-CoA hydratase